MSASVSSHNLGAQMNKAIPVDYIAVLASYVLDGQQIIEVTCADFDAYKALPDAVEWCGKILGKTGWNSDLGKACYKMGVSLAKAIR